MNDLLGLFSPLGRQRYIRTVVRFLVIIGIVIVLFLAGKALISDYLKKSRRTYVEKWLAMMETLGNHSFEFYDTSNTDEMLRDSFKTGLVEFS
jgi:hypothetical protein